MVSQNASDDFNGLDLLGLYASRWEFVVQEKLVISLRDGDFVRPTGIPNTARCYELQFNRILGGSIRAESPLGKIESYCAQDNTELSNRLLKSQGHMVYGETFYHFEMVFERGRLDVVARDHVFTVTGWFSTR
jgi:hypothetical protein